jgi:large subunit ribosomal protein L4
MMQAKLFDKSGKENGTIELVKNIFEQETREPLLWETVNVLLNNRRKGFASTKTRAEVHGGGKKPWRQKGIGWARHGSTRSPVWRGGGVTFGPRPRDYTLSMPQKKKLKALVSALSAKARENKILVIEEMTLDTPKTKNFTEILKNVNLGGAKLLVAVAEMDKNLLLATRNVPKVYLKRTADINCYDVLEAEYVLLTKEGLKKLEQRCATRK